MIVWVIVLVLADSNCLTIFFSVILLFVIVFPYRFTIGHSHTALWDRSSGNREARRIYCAAM